MEIPNSTIDAARDALARDEARTHAQHLGTLVILAGALIAAVAWVALANGILLVATTADVAMGIVLLVVGAIVLAAASFVIVLGARMRRRAWAAGHEPASPDGKPNERFNEVPSKYALPGPYLNHGGSGV